MAYPTVLSTNTFFNLLGHFQGALLDIKESTDAI